MTDALVAPETPTPEPAVADPTSTGGRGRRWRIAGGLALALAVVVWLVVNYRLGIYWEDRRDPVIAAGGSWSGGGITLKVDGVATGTTLTMDNADPLTATPGAAFVAVGLDYTLDDPAVNLSCALSLVGDGREWSGAESVPYRISDLMPGFRDDCANVDDLGAPTTSGLVGALVEVPTSALGEITGVRVIVGDASKTLADLPRLFGSASPRVVLTIELPS